MDLSKANKTANVEFPPTKKLADLSKENIYRITKFREANTKFGKFIIAETENEFSVFLPKRIAELFENDAKMYEDLKKSVEDRHLGFQYIGGYYNKIEFKNL